MKDIGIDQTKSTNNYTFKKVVQGKPYTKKNYVLKNIFRSLAIISLLAAFIIGKTWNRIDYHSFLSEKLHNTNLLKIDEQTYYYEDSDHLLRFNHPHTEARTVWRTPRPHHHGSHEPARDCYP